jgi:MFS superfamily sulfate permease-like transporter
VVRWARRSEYGILVAVILAAAWFAVKIIRKRRQPKA